MKIVNNQNLIGDLVGTVPLMADLARIHGGLEVYQTLDEGKWVYPLLESSGVRLVSEVADGVQELDIERAFKFGCDNELYMTQCWHEQFGLPVPEHPPRPDLDVPDLDVPVYDYIFAPFSRSTPEEQKWGMEKWVGLLGALSKVGFRVAVFGNSKFESSSDWGKHAEFDRPLPEVLNMIKKCRRGVVSINTGISHLCFAMGTKNYLLNNQGRGWAVQPDAISIETYIPGITVEEVLEVLRCR